MANRTRCRRDVNYAQWECRSSVVVSRDPQEITNGNSPGKDGWRRCCQCCIRIRYSRRRSQGQRLQRFVLLVLLLPICTDICPGWLLRVAKAPVSGSPARFNYLRQQEFYAKQITPFLKTHAIQQQLVVLRNTNIIPQLNAFLRSIDHQRKEKFRGTFVSESNWGLLVEDMRISGE